MQRSIKTLLALGARLPKELMLFVKNMMFLDGAIATLAPDLDLFAEVESIALMFAAKHGERIMAQLGLEHQADWAPDMAGVKAGFGLDESTEHLTHRELQARRAQVREKFEDRGAGRRGAVAGRRRRSARIGQHVAGQGRGEVAPMAAAEGGRVGVEPRTCFPPTRRARRPRPCWATPSGQPATDGRAGARQRGAGRRARRAGGGPTPSWRTDVDRLATALLAAGIEHGDRVGIWAPNCPEWVLVQYATRVDRRHPGHHQPGLPDPRARVRAAPGRHRAPGGGVGLQDVGLRGHDRRRCGPRCPELREVTIIGSAGWDASGRGARRRRPSRPRWRRRLSADDPINIQYTSGTTGFPKGATLSHHNILNNGFFVGELCGYSEADRVCIPVPFYHCFGMTMGNLGATTHGATMVIPAPGFDPAATLAAVAQERCTSLYGVPTMFIAELAEPSFDDLRPLQPAHRDHGGLALSGGGDEAGGRPHGHGGGDHLLRHDRDLARLHPDGGRRLAGAAGLDRRSGAPPRRGQDRRPRDGAHVPRGTPGELCTRGYSVMLGYWGEPERTAEAIDAARYMHTGDLAVMDDEGYVNITGRIKDMVIRGGENIYPREIEEFLYSHPDVVDAQVIGVPDVALRRGAHGVGPAAPGRRATDGRRVARPSAPAGWPTTRSPATCTSSRSSR